MGAYSGHNSIYTEAAKELGKEIVSRDLKLVYGDGSVGLMGELANTVLQHGGFATGVITKDLYNQEIAHQGLHKLHIVDSMTERKSLMVELADAYIALPGGIGTLEELLAVWTTAKIGIHNNPFGLLNTKGYFNKMLEFINQMILEKFLYQDHKELITIKETPQELLDSLFPKK
jgi:uncharacterized protein (TIGR00730 family)